MLQHDIREQTKGLRPCDAETILKQVQHMVQDDEVFWIAALPLVACNDWIWLYENVLRWSDPENQLL